MVIFSIITINIACYNRSIHNYKLRKMQKRFQKLFIYSLLGFIFICSLIFVEIHHFHANSWLAIFVFCLCFLISLNCYLLRLEKDVNKNEESNFLSFHLYISFFYAVIASFFLTTVILALFALQTQYFGQDKNIILKGQVYSPTFTLEKKPCRTRLKFPESGWSTFAYLCLDTKKHNFYGYYKLHLKTSFAGSTIQDYDWINDQLTYQQHRALDMDPHQKRLLEIYAKLERDLGPPLSDDEADDFLNRPNND